MKVYKFFKIPDIDEDDDIDLERKYILYAITNNKDYAQRFKEDRNMKKFICKVHTDVDKEEYAEMCNADRGCVLGVYALTTIFEKTRIRKHAVSKDVLMTYNEKQLIDDAQTIIDDESVWQTMPYPLIFKPKYISVLKDLQYLTYYTLMTCEHLPYHLAEKLADMTDDYSAPSLIHDEVALFIQMIQNTL